jgi:hypothetical protein
LASQAQTLTEVARDVRLPLSDADRACLDRLSALLFAESRKVKR